MRIESTNIKYKQNFQAGLTSKMSDEIAHCDINKISNELAKKGISTDFKNNKILAWCSLKCTEIISHLNKQYSLNLGYPLKIVVEDFKNLEDTPQNALGFCNFLPCDIGSGKTIFLNEAPSGDKTYWNSIDELADEAFANNHEPTDFFLAPIFHEFAHTLHEHHLIQKLGVSPMIDFLLQVLSPKYLKNYQKNFGETIKNEICEYATKDPMETIACDITKRCFNNIDKNTLQPKNFIKFSPYGDFWYLKQILTDTKKRELNKMLHDTYNGKLIHLGKGNEILQCDTPIST